MKKIISTVLAVFVIAGSLGVSALGADEEKIEVYVDGHRVDVTGYSYMSDSKALVPLHLLCLALGAEEIYWDEDVQAMSVSGGGAWALFYTQECYVLANGRYLYNETGHVLKDGQLMIEADILSRIYGAPCTREGNVLSFKTTGQAIVSGDEFYDEQDLKWMSRIISAEAGGEPFLGQVAVGSVVMNRVRSDEFPDTVYDVVFDNRYGVQFTPAYTGAVYNTPSQSCVTAAKLALDGADIVEGSMYFVASYTADHCWVGANRPFLTQLGNHCFYA